MANPTSSPYEWSKAGYDAGRSVPLHDAMEPTVEPPPCLPRSGRRGRGAAAYSSGT